MIGDGREEIRCPRCRRLLAVRVDGGTVEARSGSHASVFVITGYITCRGCVETVAVSRHKTVADLIEVSEPESQ